MFESTIDFFRMAPVDYPNILTISIGTGAARIEEKYNTKLASKWGMLDWLLHGGTTPLLEIFSQASADMVDFHSSLIFQALYSEDNYLRIQVIINNIHNQFHPDCLIDGVREQFSSHRLIYLFCTDLYFEYCKSW